MVSNTSADAKTWWYHSTTIQYLADQVTENNMLGCGGPLANTLTLYDAGRLYEGVADGSLLSGTYRDSFYTLMAGKSYDFTGVWSATSTIIEEEAPAALTAQQKNLFKAIMRMSYKAGGYTYCTSANCGTGEDYRSLAGSVRIPFCVSGQTELREYV